VNVTFDQKQRIEKDIMSVLGGFFWGWGMPERFEAKDFIAAYITLWSIKVDQLDKNVASKIIDALKKADIQQDYMPFFNQFTSIKKSFENFAERITEETIKKFSELNDEAIELKKDHELVNTYKQIKFCKEAAKALRATLKKKEEV
jgi:hypothetical protein